MNLYALLQRQRLSGDPHPGQWLAQPIWPRRLQCDHVLVGHHGCVNTVRWDAAGSLLVSGSDDRTVILWRVGPAAPALLRTLPTLHTHNIFDARLRPFDENVVYTAAADGTIGSVEVCDNPTPRLLYTAYSGIASKLDFQPLSANAFLATFGDGAVRLFDVRLPTPCLGHVVRLREGVTAVQFMPHHASALFAIGADDPYLRVCDLRHGVRTGPAEVDLAAVVCAYTAPHLREAAAAPTCFSLRAGRPAMGHEVGISGVAWARDGAALAANFRGDDVILFDTRYYNPTTVNNTAVDTTSVLQVYRGRANVQTCAKDLSFCFEDTHLCTGGDDGSIFLFHVASGALRRRLAADRCVVNCVAPHPTLPMLASSGIDAEVKVWGVGEDVAPEEPAPRTAPPRPPVSWHERLEANAPNVTAPEARRRLEAAAAGKCLGNEKVAAKAWAPAVEKYRHALRELHFLAPSPSIEAEQAAVRRACHLNLALCYLHTEQFKEARDAATSVLETDPHNVKALFRRAVALRHLKEYPAALADVERALGVEPSSAEMQRQTLRQDELLRRRRERDVFRRMFLGAPGDDPDDRPPPDPDTEWEGDHGGPIVELPVGTHEPDGGPPPSPQPSLRRSVDRIDGVVVVTVWLPDLTDLSGLTVTVGGSELQVSLPRALPQRVPLPHRLHPAAAQFARAWWNPGPRTLSVAFCRPDPPDLINPMAP